MDIAEVLRSAWQITWKYKVLWIFGILAGCTNGSRWELRGNRGGNDGTGPQFQPFMEQVRNWMAAHPIVVILIVIAFLVLFILAIVLGTVGHIGLIKGTLKADAGAQRVSFGELWSESLPYFWRIFGLNLLVGLAVLFAVLVIATAAFVVGALTLGIGLLCFIPLVCVLVPLAILLNVVVQQAELAIVIENLGIQDGLRRGWNVFKSNLGRLIIMVVILVVIGGAISLVLALPILVAVLPALTSLALSSQTGQVNTNPLIVAALCFTAYLPVFIVLNGILMTFLQSSWTLTYLRLTRPRAEPPVEAPVVPPLNA